MTKDEIFDINGRVPQVGDTIALATGWGTNNAYINITVEKSGLEWGNHGYTRKTTLQFPMKHCKFLILGDPQSKKPNQ